MSLESSVFDKRMLNNDKYRQYILKKLSNSPMLNTSEALTALIGFIEKWDDTDTSLKGAFYADTHVKDIGIDKRKSAVRKLESLLRTDDEKKILEHSECLYLNGSKASRHAYRNSKLLICKDNIKEIFPNSINCKGDKSNEYECGRSWSIEYINNTPKTDKGELYLPHMCLADKFNNIFDNLVQHSICMHSGVSENTVHFTIKGRNIGILSPCLYVISLEIPPNKLWVHSSGVPIATRADYIGITNSDDKNFVPYFDYLILVPDPDNNYHLLNITAKYNDTDYSKPKSLENGKWIKEPVRFKSMELFFRHKNNFICCSGKPCDCELTEARIELCHGKLLTIDDTKQFKPIVHLFIINNYQKLS